MVVLGAAAHFTSVAVGWPARLAPHVKLENGDLRYSIHVNPEDDPGRALKGHLLALDQRLGERVPPDTVKPVRTTGTDQDLELDGAQGTAELLTEVDTAQELAPLGQDRASG